VTKSHGLKGEVTILLDNSFHDFSRLQSVFLLGKDNKLIPFFIESFSGQGNKLFVKFEDVNGPENASKISKSIIYLPKSLRPKSGKGEFYDDEVINFEVVDSTHGNLGKVVEVIQTGANRLLCINYNEREILIPIQGELITTINKRSKKITVNLPDGFLDI
jgi:16S rRNA processing protein RimM